MVSAVRGRHVQLLLGGVALLAAATPVAIADSSAGIQLLAADTALAGWHEKVFNGRSRYQAVIEGGKTVLQAHSQGTASGLYRPLDVDLEKYPLLHWRWKIDRRLEGLDETSKPGDDFAARIYVIARDGLFFWKTRAICYVWSSNQEKGTSWDNAYAGESVKMLAVRSRADALSTWYAEQRDVYRDFVSLFGEPVSRIDSIAVMVDTDDSRTEATSYYSDIHLSRH
jgi:hypothetical protein